MTGVSACLIVLDEERRLPACLASLWFCDEVVVVDGGSRDHTVDVARAAGAKVIENPWPGYGAQRNVALDHASNDWVLEIDADERVTPDLAREIRAFLESPPQGIDMAAVPSRQEFLGRKLGPSARYPGYRYRLFRRHAHRHDETRAVHEGLWSSGAVHAFTADLEHRLADSWSEAIADRWRYARLEAGHVDPPAHAHGYLLGALVRPAIKGAWRTIVLGGWRDGWQGLAVIALDALSDSVVWIRVSGRRLRSRAGTGESVVHFGQRPRTGAASIVALASGTAASVQAARWLTDARGLGADGRLVCADVPEGEPPLPTRRLARFAPLLVIRALDAEQQLRAIDVVVAFGVRARLLGRFLPRQVGGPARARALSPAQAIAHGLAARPAAES